MDKKTQERMTNRIMLTMAISFVACVAMYYIYGAIGNSIFNPAATFITLAALFVVCAVLMMVLGMKESKKLNLGMAEGYKQSLKARLYFNFEIFFIASAVLSLVIWLAGSAWRKSGATTTIASGYSNVMVVLAVLILVYNIALIIWTYAVQAIAKKKVREARMSKKATAKAALKEKRAKSK